MAQRLASSKATWLAFAVLAITAPLTSLRSVHGWSEASRMALTQALVEFQTLAIDQTAFMDTGDKVLIGGHYYSDKLALPSLLAALVYAPLFRLGLRLEWDSGNLAYLLINLFTMKVVWLLGLAAFHHALSFTRLSGAQRLMVTFALGLSSLYLTWSATFNNHGLAAGWVAMGFAALLSLRRPGNEQLKCVGAGLSFGLAGASDMPILAVYAGFALWFLAQPDLRRLLPWYMLPLPLALAPSLAVNHAISGSFLPVQLVADYFRWPGSPWTADLLSGGHLRGGLDFALYGLTALLGDRGFVWYNPLLLVAIPMAVREAWRQGPFWREAVVAAGVSLVVGVYYIATSANFGGASYSIRWWVPLLPLWYFFLAPWFDTVARWRTWAFWVLFGLGVFVALVGVVEPWSRSGVPPLAANLQEFGPRLDFWLGRLGFR